MNFAYEYSNTHLGY